MNKFKAVLGISTLTPEAKVVRAQGIHDDMQNSGNFLNANLPVGYTNMQTGINNLQSAIIATNNGTVTSTTNMHEQERLLVIMFNLIKAHVEYVASTNPHPETIITSAGMQVSSTGGSNAVTELTLNTEGNGSVSVRVPRGSDEKAFIFEAGTDGTAFVKVKSSSLTKISITGYTPGSTVYVRYYAITKNGDTAMSQAKNIIVL